jgi:hypothetical protein
VADYVQELKCLLANTNHYDPIELPHRVVWVKKWLEKKKSTSIFKGTEFRV